MTTTKRSLINQADLSLQVAGTSLRSLSALEGPEDTRQVAIELLTSLAKINEGLKALRALIRQDEYVGWQI